MDSYLWKLEAIQTQQHDSTELSTDQSTTPPGSPPGYGSSFTDSVLPCVEQRGTIARSTLPIDDPVLDDDERQILLQSVDEASHRQCEWMVGNSCVACLFQDFQRGCIDALVRNEIKKTEVADAMAVIGVFAPSMPTTRMKSVFSEKLLHVIAKSTVDLPDTGLDDGAMMTAVKVRLYVYSAVLGGDVLLTLHSISWAHVAIHQGTKGRCGRYSLLAQQEGSQDSTNARNTVSLLNVFLSCCSS